ncbi:hypothetical protein QR680_003891 [Steinernema hermaphroditum]|uniref:Uncharacterized protein n=1 Tax=Steinernema hermaphroditum TaxID=289476 RepID=A0AA39HN10_9BILA|nr:hypothetical protein QR680_003891 [Steinernema hermaphroditum]
MRHRVDLRCTKIPIKSDLDGFRVRSASLSTTQITTMPQIPLIKIATVEGYKVYGGVWVILLILAFVSGIYTYTFPTTSCVPLNSPHNVSETIDLLSYEWAEEEKSVRNARIVVESKLLPVIFGMAAFVAFLPEFILFWLWLTWNAVEYWEFCFLRFLAAVLNLLMPIIIAISLAQHFKFADFPTELLLPVAANITYLLKSGVQEYECILNANKINNSAIFYVISIQSVYGLWCLFLAFSAYMLMRVIDVPRSRRSIVARFLHWITNLDLAVQGGSCNLTSDRPISAALPGSHIMERVPPYFLPRLLFRYASSEMHLSSLLNRSAGETTTPGPSERRSQLIMAEHRIEYQLGNGDTAVALAGFADDLSPGRLKASKTIRGSPKVQWLTWGPGLGVQKTRSECKGRTYHSDIDYRNTKHPEKDNLVMVVAGPHENVPMDVTAMANRGSTIVAEHQWNLPNLESVLDRSSFSYPQPCLEVELQADLLSSLLFLHLHLKLCSTPTGSISPSHGGKEVLGDYAWNRSTRGRPAPGRPNGTRLCVYTFHQDKTTSHSTTIYQIMSQRRCLWFSWIEAGLIELLGNMTMTIQNSSM